MSMGECQWGASNCLNFGVKCVLCATPNFHYKEPKDKKFGLNKKAMKADKRTGSKFEYKNHDRIKKNLVDGVATRLTPNSGAGYVKGDQEISGIITVMEELKTKVKEQTPGKETFTIHKKWLDKLHREALAASKEFWYLKFSFLEADDHVYCITESELIDSMIKTMVEDRKSIKIVEAKQDIAEKMRRKTETDLYAAQAEIDLLNAKIKLLELESQKD